MRKFIDSRLVVILAAATILMLGAASAALATTGTGSQDRDFAVSVAAGAVGIPDPDVATVGDTVRVVLSVKDNKAWSFEFKHDDVQLRVTLQTPVGEPYKVSFQIAMGPGQTLRLPFEFTVHNSYPKGTYALTLDAIEVKHPVPMSTATATLTIM